MSITKIDSGALLQRYVNLAQAT